MPKYLRDKTAPQYLGEKAACKGKIAISVSLDHFAFEIVLASYGRCNKLPQTERLTTEIYSLTVSSAGSFWRP